MYAPCVHHEKPMFLDVTLSLDSSQSFQTALDSSRPMTSCHVTSQSCAIFLLSQTNNITTTISYLCPNPNSKVCPHFRLIILVLSLDFVFSGCHNKYSCFNVYIFMNQSNNTKSPTTYEAIIFLVGLMMICSFNVNVIKYSSWDRPSVYILMGNSFLVILALLFFLRIQQ